MQDKQYDFLIVGQGLAGSLIGWHLQQRKQKYLIIDFPHNNSATNCSAGIVNPLIGRSFNLPWNFEELNLIARRLYKKLSLELGIKIIHEKKILRVLDNSKQLNIIRNKLSNSKYQSFIGDLTSSYNFLQFPEQAFWTNNCYWVDLAKLTKCLRHFFIKQERLLEDKFDYHELQIKASEVLYKKYSFKKIIFAEGYRATFNPYASFLEFRPAKGEIIDVKIPNLNLDQILNFGHFLLPLGNDLYRLGATYDWTAWESKLPLNKEHPLIISLEKIIALPYEIVQHKLGVRPIVAGQKPVIGRHPVHQQMFFLNGLGSKGALMSPYCALQLINFIIDQNPINPEINTERFFSNRL